MVRLAKLVIDPTQLEQYNALLKEEIEASVKLEPGVLTLYAVADKNRPDHITILEIYADADAYKKHIQTPHFLKYKNGTKDMVKSLELTETTHYPDDEDKPDWVPSFRTISRRLVCFLYKLFVEVCLQPKTWRLTRRIIKMDI